MTLKLTDADFDRLVKFLHTEYGITLEKKRVLIEGRLSNEIQRRGFIDYHDYLNTVYTDKTGTEIVYLLNKLTTNHTYFMREPEHYDFMQRVFLPEITAERRVKKHINVWSAGCSSGEEAYTTQMQMLEFLGPQSSLWDTTILASDISNNVLDKAAKGIYHKDSMRNLSPAWTKRYFTPLENDCFQVSRELQKRVNFKVFNLMKPIIRPAVPYDLIFCRNVMIYFDLETKVELVKRFYDVLAPGGYLFIGHAESIPRDATKYQYIKPAIYRKPL